ncbi:MAG: aldehyde ferredoxin oxidoreductase C-terminal domain-containing protein [Anaerolineae bacterium]
MSQAMVRVLVIDAERQRYHLRTLRAGNVRHDPCDDYTLLGGEALCQYILREDPGVLVIARGPLPFFAGNKTTVGYVSPLTSLPHYSFVGGRGFAALFNLGLDAIVFESANERMGESANQRITNHESRIPNPRLPITNYLVISGRAPRLTVEWKSAAELPAGQRSAFYWLLEHELGGRQEDGSVFTLGEAARYGFRAANLAVDGLYHAGRGGAGHVFAQHAAALVLRAEPLTLEAWFGLRAEAFRDLRNGELRERLETYCARLSRRDGGTVTKLYTTGSGKNPTLPARNAQRLGYALADLGARKVLHASRVGQTGCHWCQVNCRHWHWVDVDYAPDERDMFLDDFEPTYALFAMLDLQPENNSLDARLRLLDEVDRRLVVPIEQLGCDVIDMGVGLAALFEGLARGIVPPEDVPDFARTGLYFGNLDVAARIVAALREGTTSPALRAIGDGPQALAEAYPALRDVVFTSGKGTLGNPGHANALWTFLMPFSRFFSHYSGQIYKVPGELKPGLSPAETQALFERVIAEMLKRETFGCLCNALSMCAFTFVIFSENGAGVELDGDLLARTLALYGIDVHREDLLWFAEAFWAQSIALKFAHGWQPPRAEDFPARVFEALSQTLGRPAGELRALMRQLIAEWERQAGALLAKYGYEDVSFH